MFRPATALLQSVCSLVAVAAVVLICRWWLPVSPTTVALTYLVGIVVVATWWGLGPATVAAVAAIVCFNAFFLPPIGTLTIADPQNWVSFVAFMATAIIVSQLSGRARARQVEALARQRDLERLYAFSRALLLAEDAPSLLSQMARRVAAAFGASAVALHDRGTDRVAWGGRERPDLDDGLRDVARTGEVARGPEGVIIVPIRLGGAPIGSLALEGVTLGDALLQSIVNLVAIGLERSRTQEAMAHAEATRKTGELRGALLDAIAHEFKTPLTAGKAAASALLSTTDASFRDRELLVIVNEELDRLQGLVSDAIYMLRLEAVDLVLRYERHRVADLVGQAVREMGARLAGHPLTIDVSADILVDADGSLLRLAVRQLLDNAVKYSPADSTIGLTALRNGDVRLAVRNTGPLIPAADRAHLFDRFYRGTLATKVPGSGLGLAIVQRIARAHGGEVSVASEPLTGTTFTVSLPASMPAAPAA